MNWHELDHTIGHLRLEESGAVDQPAAIPAQNTSFWNQSPITASHSLRQNCYYHYMCLCCCR